jgi:hypothetical protein
LEHAYCIYGNVSTALDSLADYLGSLTTVKARLVVSVICEFLRGGRFVNKFQVDSIDWEITKSIYVATSSEAYTVELKEVD